MCEIVIKQIPHKMVRSYDFHICDPTWEQGKNLYYNKCHSLLAILATTGMENYQLNFTILEPNITHDLSQEKLTVRYHIHDEQKPLLYRNNTNTYEGKTSIKLSLGLNVLFWCSSRLRPRVHRSEVERSQYSSFKDLRNGLNLQITPGINEVWDTYLLNEMRNGYSGKSEASPVISHGNYPFLCIDRVAVCRQENKPSGLLQQSWLKAIRTRVHGHSKFLYYNTRGHLPMSSFPTLAHEVTFLQLIHLDYPKVGIWK